MGRLCPRFQQAPASLCDYPMSRRCREPGRWQATRIVPLRQGKATMLIRFAPAAKRFSTLWVVWALGGILLIRRPEGPEPALERGIFFQWAT